MTPMTRMFWRVSSVRVMAYVGGVTPPTVAVYNYIERLQAGDVIMFSVDYGPASMPELHPQALAPINRIGRPDAIDIGQLPVGQAVLPGNGVQGITALHNIVAGLRLCLGGLRP